jgi:hypothetical protein
MGEEPNHIDRKKAWSSINNSIIPYSVSLPGQRGRGRPF